VQAQNGGVNSEVAIKRGPFSLKKIVRFFDPFLIKGKDPMTNMKKMILSSNLHFAIAFPLLALATSLPDYGVTSFLEIAARKINGKHPPHTLPAEEKQSKTEAAKTIRLAQLRYLLLVLFLGGAAWLLAFLLLRIMGNAIALD
jgi:hypothetical protein